MKTTFFRINHTTTLYVRIETNKCQGCWKCVESCPKNVIGKIKLPFHNHVRFNYGDQCLGCLKCVETCEFGALIKLQDKAERFHAKEKSLG